MRLTELAHQHLKSIIHAGDSVIDASAGNGHDTVFLAHQVTASGNVLAIDIQAQAITATRQRLHNENIHWVQLRQANHADLAAYVPKHHQVRAIVFNLGYLPGSDKRVITQAENTLKALHASLDLLDEPGMLSILSYRGHDGGNEEYCQIKAWLKTLDTQQFHIQQFSNHQPQSPVLITLTRGLKSADISF